MEVNTNISNKIYFSLIKINRGDNIKTDLKEIRSEGVDWLHLAQDRDFNNNYYNI